MLKKEKVFGKLKGIKDAGLEKTKKLAEENISSEAVEKVQNKVKQVIQKEEPSDIDKSTVSDSQSPPETVKAALINESNLQSAKEPADGPVSSDKYQKIKEELKKNGIKLAQIAQNPRVFDKACDIAYKRIPIPWRWFVGKKRVRKMMNKFKEQIPRIEQALSTQSQPNVSGGI